MLKKPLPSLAAYIHVQHWAWIHTSAGDQAQPGCNQGYVTYKRRLNLSPGVSAFHVKECQKAAEVSHSKTPAL